MKLLAKLLVLVLMCGSVQGQVPCGDYVFTFEKPPGSTMLADGRPVDWRTDERVCDTAYWYYNVSVSYLHRRLDRWYKKPVLDTVWIGLPCSKPCDRIEGFRDCECYTVTVDSDDTCNYRVGANLRHILDNVTLSDKWEVKTKPNDSTVYAKRVKKIETKWVIPE